MNELRSKCRHRIDLGRDRLFRRAQRARNGPGTAATEPRIASNAGEPNSKPQGAGRA